MKKLLALLLGLCMAFGSAACNSNRKGSNDPNVLDVYCYIAGYGDTWLTNPEKTGVLDIFQNEPWVKEKYPDLKVNYSSNGEASFANNKLYNQKSNTTDLFFSSWFGDVPESLMVNLTDAVYLTDAPDKIGTKIMDMLPDDVKASLERNDVAERNDGYDNYYTVKAFSSFYSFMYNKKFLAALELQLPVTTKEFADACVKAETVGYKYTVSGQEQTSKTGLMMSAKSSYVQYMFPVFWCQYEGMENYRNFFLGKNSDDEITAENFKQKGRYRAFQTMESIVKKHAWMSAGESDHTKAQNEFLLGNGLFHWNGDYFTTEMANQRAVNESRFGVKDEIGMMSTPVMSDIVEKLSFYDEEQGFFENERVSGYFTSTEKPFHKLDAGRQAYYDNILASVIREIDAGKSYAESDLKNTVTENDWKIIKDARAYKGFYSDSAEEAVIPSGSPAKELASDFLRFMFTEKATRAFSEASKGLSFPVKYYENLSASDYDEATKDFEPEAADKFDLMYKSGATYIPSDRAFPLGRAGLEKYNYSGNEGLNFVTSGSSYTDPEQFFLNDILYYTGDNIGNWNSLLRLAGIM